VGHNKQTSGEIRNSFCTKFEDLLINFFYYPKGCTLYVLQVWL